ncbi:Protein of unknown function [Cotesia congregata]|uniref:Uncharacterized protein n=1 Tax=Cotesia congregata TaxID=51543 RepID=A0A8J2HI51_COTCN|nr:Protein of unknown function [Cotesia congregata]
MSERLSANSRDVISIIIPEDPDDNLNIDQLTLDFRRQLGRLIQRSRFNKLENNRFRYAPNDTTTLLKQKKTLKDHRQKLNIDRYLISKFDRRTDSRYNRQGTKQPFYRSNLLKRLSSKRRGNVLQNKRKMRENKWRHINNFSQSRLVNNNINKNNQSSLDVIDVENNSVNKRNSFAFNYRKRKLQSNKVLSNNKVNNYMILNPEDVEFSTLQKSNSIPDCLRKIDENGKEYLLCFNGSAINLSETMMRTIKNKNYIYDRENNVNTNNPSLNDKSQKKVYPINIQVNDYKEIEKILQNPETILKRINPLDIEKNNNININEINNKKSRGTQIDDNSENNDIIKLKTSNSQQLKTEDYSNDRVSDFLSDNARHYDSINNQATYLRNASQLDFDNKNFPLRISRSVSNNQFSKTPMIHARQRSDKLIKHKLPVKKFWTVEEE